MLEIQRGITRELFDSLHLQRASVRRQTVDERPGQSFGPYFAEVPQGVGVQTEGQDTCLQNRAASCPSSLTRDISQVEKKRLDVAFLKRRSVEGRRFRCV